MRFRDSRGSVWGGNSLWVQVGPSQPSLQTQVKVSPLTTQVPPYSQGLGRQLEFLAEGGEREGGREVFKSRSVYHSGQVDYLSIGVPNDL